MLANNENSNKKHNIILKGSLICFTFAFLGILSGMLIHIYYPNLLENICNLEIINKESIEPKLGWLLVNLGIFIEEFL